MHLGIINFLPVFDNYVDKYRVMINKVLTQCHLYDSDWQQFEFDIIRQHRVSVPDTARAA